jgi:hypothetical protein
VKEEYGAFFVVIPQVLEYSVGIQKLDSFARAKSQSSFGSQLLLIHHPPKRKKAQIPSQTGHSSKRHKAPSKFGILF